MARLPRIALVAREVEPLDGGGIGAYVTAQAHLLSDVAEVTVFTRADVRDRYRRLRDEDDPRLPSERVRFEFIPEPIPEPSRKWLGVRHEWSASAYRALCEHFRGEGPDLVEFPDFFGEGAVTAQARLTRVAELLRTTVCVRAHTTSEMCDVLDGVIRRDNETRIVHALERFSIHHADRFLWPGGDVLDTYRRFFGHDALAPDSRIRHHVRLPLAASATPAGDQRLRLLYLGRLERRKGVQNLIRALSALPEQGWEVTLVGGDTQTGPLASSVRAQLEAMTGGHPQFKFLEAVPRTEIAALIAAHDVVVVPSSWECWPTVALEALACNRPLLATPVGGLVEMVGAAPGEWGPGGRLLAGTDSQTIAAAVEALVADPARLRDLTAAGRPRAQFELLVGEEDVRAQYLSLAEAAASEPRRRPRRAAMPPLVSVVVPYYRLDTHVAAAVESALSQTHPRIEVVIVNDGSFRPEDGEALDRLRALDRRVLVVNQPNSGLSQARNLGIAVARGRYVLPLDADNVLAPGFAARALEVLDAEPAVAWVSAWLRFIDEAGDPVGSSPSHYHPLGSEADVLDALNSAADAVALIRRSVFDAGFRYDPDLTSYEDWLLYHQLRDAGHVGHVIPEPLIGYRLREASMLRDVGFRFEEQLADERLAHRRERAVEWMTQTV